MRNPPPHVMSNPPPHNEESTSKTGNSHPALQRSRFHTQCAHSTLYTHNLHEANTQCAHHTIPPGRGHLRTPMPYRPYQSHRTHITINHKAFIEYTPQSKPNAFNTHANISTYYTRKIPIVRFILTSSPKANTTTLDGPRARSGFNSYSTKFYIKKRISKITSLTTLAVSYTSQLN